MERLVVKNFGPIKKIDINIPRLLVLIGEQASGKSTIGRLIYAFKRISGLFGQSLRFSAGELSAEAVVEFAVQMLASFDGSFFCDNTELCYHYSNDYNIIISGKKGNVRIALSKTFEDNIKAVYDFTHEIQFEDELKKKTTEEQRKHFRNTMSMCLKLRQSIGSGTIYEYMKAARNTPLYTGEFSSPLPNISAQMYKQFESHLAATASINKMKSDFVEKYMSNALPLGKRLHQPNSDIQQQDKYLSTYRKRCSLLAENYVSVAMLSKDILKGVLCNTEEKGWGFNVDGSNKKVFIPYAALSSGQSSALPIVVLLDNMCVEQFRLPFSSAVIEEPEAHIYPDNQFKIVELLANVMQMNTAAQFVITTHSPYILASVHALTAYGLSQNKKDITELNKYKYLCPLESDQNSLGMYLIKGGKSCDLRDVETGLFDTSEIDKISEDINTVFDLSVLNAED